MGTFTTGDNNIFVGKVPGDQVSISLVSNNVADTSADVAAVVELM